MNARNLDALSPGQKLTAGASVLFTAVAAAAELAGPHSVATFALAAVALAALAAVVGMAVEQVGEHISSNATGLLHAALGNLPELLVGIFALRAGLVDVVRAALVGSVLSNILLVLGIACMAGGLRHGPQRFPGESPRMIGTLLTLAVAALVVPTLAFRLHGLASHHVAALSNITAVLLIVVYALSVPFMLGGGLSTTPDEQYRAREPVRVWPLQLAVILLIVGSLGAAFVSDWFVNALEPAAKSLGLSTTFTGLVIVAIASNAVENVGGVTFALKARPDYAVSTILTSPLQVALLLTPMLVLFDRIVGTGHFTLVFPPLEVAVLAIATLVVVMVIFDGEYVWLEGAALVGLYCIIAAAFWWG
jgi:Ca2+:H+ antiporter